MLQKKVVIFFSKESVSLQPSEVFPIMMKLMDFYGNQMCFYSAYAGQRFTFLDNKLILITVYAGT